MKRIIETVAKLVKDDIKSIDVSSDVYPSSTEMSEKALKFIPALLQNFLRTLLLEKMWI